MTRKDTASIIKQKARVAREEFDARAMSPSKALRLALAKSAGSLYDLAISITTIEQVDLRPDAVQSRLGDDGLLILLDGHNGMRGAVKLDTQFIAALIEIQIIGEIRANPAPPRVYTQTDAAMAASFIDLVLKTYDGQLLAENEGHLPLDLRFGDKIEDARSLGLALEGGQFDLFSITADLAEGAKSGTISILLPRISYPVSPEAKQKSNVAARSDSLKKSALEATATLDAVLDRIALPLKDICSLKVGMRLPISPTAIVETQLVAPKNHVVAEVRLGQLNGQRAVRFASTDGMADDLAGAAETSAVMSAPDSAEAATSPVQILSPAQPETLPADEPGRNSGDISALDVLAETAAFE